MALAPRMFLLLQIQAPNYLAGNQQLVTFVNSRDHLSPPHWTIKAFTQSCINYNSNNRFKIFKIGRNLNRMAHLLAKQARVPANYIP